MPPTNQHNQRMNSHQLNQTNNQKSQLIDYWVKFGKLNEEDARRSRKPNDTIRQDNSVIFQTLDKFTGLSLLRHLAKPFLK